MNDLDTTIPIIPWDWSVVWVTLYPSQNSYVAVLTPNTSEPPCTQNVNLFGNGIVADVIIKWRRGQTEIEWVPNAWRVSL